MAAEETRTFTVLFRAQVPGGDVVEYIAWAGAAGTAVRINGKIQAADGGDPLDSFLN